MARSGPSGGQAGDEDGNLMWLVDFKLDFFNDIDKNGDRGEERGTKSKERDIKETVKLNFRFFYDVDGY